MPKAIAFLAFVFMFGTSARAIEDGRTEIDYEMPSQVRLDEMQALLQRFVNETYHVSFRLFAYSSDFNHGHFLYDEKLPTSRKPFAVLWHTQERGSCVGMSFQFDPSSRNWIQWLDPTRPLENARKYKRHAYPDTPMWRKFVERDLPDAEDCSTIHPEMLDPELVGHPVAAESQWKFVQKNCEEFWADRIEILLPPNGDRICLEIKKHGDD